MAQLVCSITGACPEMPVYSKTGYIFEKRIIEEHLKTSNTCPITGEELTINDLLPIKANKLVKPRPNAATSIPGMLSLLQTEWDSLMAETFELRNHQIDLKHQLSHALYQHDAACRVVGRLLKERDALRQQLSQLQNDLLHLPDRSAQQSQAYSYSGLSEEAIDSFQSLAKSLMARRKHRDLSMVLPSEQLKQFQERASYTLHSAVSPGIITCSIHPNPLGPEDAKSNQVFTGGADGAIVLFDLTRQQTISHLSGHLKKVNQIVSHGGQQIVLSCSDDKSVRVWVPVQSDTELPTMIDYKTSYILKKHTKAVTSLSVHPSGDYFSTASKDGSWGLHELHAGQTCALYTQLPTTFQQITFHPDGMLIGAAGADTNIHMFDIKNCHQSITTLEGHEKQIKSFSFSENGYYLATASDDQTVKLWDLRKSATLQTIHLHLDEALWTPSHVTFDNSGMYLAVCGHDAKDLGIVQIFDFIGKTQLQLTCNLVGHTALASCAAFGPNANYLISSSLDRQLKVWTTPSS